MRSSVLTRVDKSEKVVIVGAGCFGLSTAYHLLKRGYKHVTVIDRAEAIPADDAASCDLNKIVRSSYQDDFYAKLAQNAIEKWLYDDDWRGIYHQSGVLVYSDKFAKIEKMYDTDRKIGAIVEPFFQGGSEPHFAATHDHLLEIPGRHAAFAAYLSPVEDANILSTPIRPAAILSPSITPSSSSASYGSESESPESVTSNDTDVEADGVRSFFPTNVELGEALLNAEGYLNRSGGWACADTVDGATKRALDLVKRAGGTVLGGKEVVGLSTADNDMNAIECSDGSMLYADVVVLATGAWTASSFPNLTTESRCEARGQCVAGVQLTADERKRYNDCPVVVDLGSTGFYVFPPNRDGVMKFALHSAGYRNVDPGTRVSKPQKIFSDSNSKTAIPEGDAHELQWHLSTVYPELVAKDFKFTRMCWYTESPDSNWLIDLHPSKSGIAFATSGSGHAYKFFPVIGGLVVDRLQGKPLDEEMPERFSFVRDRESKKQEEFRNQSPKDLKM